MEVSLILVGTDGARREEVCRSREREARWNEMRGDTKSLWTGSCGIAE